MSFCFFSNLSRSLERSTYFEHRVEPEESSSLPAVLSLNNKVRRDGLLIVADNFVWCEVGSVGVVDARMMKMMQEA